MSACLLSLSVMSLLLPTAFHASWADANSANTATLQVSRGTSVILLVIYVLYLLFQLKSHAYLYESTPQQIIDEESHPGILHDVLNSSTSSSSSDTSSSRDSDESSGSHTTAKRINRAFRRKRRQSSASSKHTPSLVSSPSADQEHFHPSVSRRPSTLHPVLSGDEADADDEKGAPDGTVVRDFDKRSKGDSSSPPVERKPTKKHKKKHRHHRRNRANSQAQSQIEMDEITPAGASNDAVDREPNQPKVEFADEKNEERRIEAQREKIQSRNPFNVRIHREAFRPPMPKMLSQNVFVTPQSGSPVPAARPTANRTPTSSRTVPIGPRRVRSLP